VAPLKLTDSIKQTLEPISDIFRQYDSWAEFNFEKPDPDVDSLNKSVKAKLKRDLSVWKNYQLIGAGWIDNPANDFAEGIVFGESVLAGEKRLSNSAVETFTQLTQTNCFVCHNTASVTENGKIPRHASLSQSHH
jgi:hypothetical protein